MSFSKKIIFVCISILGIVGALFSVIYFFFSSFSKFEISPSAFLQNNFIEEKISALIGEENSDIMKIFPELLGLEKPLTYLILFQNNTELRPGGGFIGSYALVRVENAQVNVLKVEGVENLDRNAPASWRMEPPLQMARPLGINRWDFRDSNWSADYPTNAKRALEFYAGENGEYAGEIDAVIAFTPTLLEAILQHIGPVQVDGMTFDAENVTRDLQYQVEYAYNEQNIPTQQRKAILEPFMKQVIEKVKADALSSYEKYIQIFKQHTEQKHIVAYFVDEQLQNQILTYAMAGQVKEFDGDYLLWVDANLAAWKTDHAMTRSLGYTLEKDEDNQWIAKAKMHYTNTGVRDWRTVDYKSYTRIFVPLGSTLKEVNGTQKWIHSNHLDDVYSGEENGKTWFGSFIYVPLGESAELEFVYALPPEIGFQIENGTYALLMQKQLGTLAHGLTLNLIFDTNIQYASVPEEQEKWGDNRYELMSDLRIDRYFDIRF